MSNNVQAEYNVVPVISVGDPPTGVIWNMVTTNEYPYRCPVIEVCCGDVVMKALVDTGSMATIMDEDAYNALRESKIELPQLPIKSTRITTAIGNKSSPIKNKFMHH